MNAEWDNAVKIIKKIINNNKKKFVNFFSKNTKEAIDKIIKMSFLPVTSEFIRGYKKKPGDKKIKKFNWSFLRKFWHFIKKKEIEMIINITNSNTIKSKLIFVNEYILNKISPINPLLTNPPW